MRFYTDPEEKSPVKPRSVRLRMLLGGITISCLLLVMGLSWHAGVTVSRLRADYDHMLQETATMEEAFETVEQLHQAMLELRHQKDLFDTMLVANQGQRELTPTEMDGLTQGLPDGVQVERLQWDADMISVTVSAPGESDVAAYESLMHAYGYTVVRTQALPLDDDRGFRFLVEGKRGGNVP